MDFEISEHAKTDLDNILNYFVNKLFNKQAAINFVTKVEKVIENIKLFPNMYEVINNTNIKEGNIRRAPIDNFNLYYLTDKNNSKTIIIRIIYSHYSENASISLN